MPINNQRIHFFFQGVKIPLRERTRLKSFIISLCKKEKKNIISLNYIFCTDKALLEINRQFLNHDYYTDIITFDLSETEKLEAEIYISTDRVRANATDLGNSFKSELHRVIFHGALHLCGYKDKLVVDSAKMREKEDFYLNQYKP